ncbi:MAG: redoxin domain-containing protein [Acidobacteriota bacterium]
MNSRVSSKPPHPKLAPSRGLPAAAVLSMLLACAAAALAATRGDADRRPATVDLIAARSIDTDGATHRLGMTKGLAPVAVVFLDTECVISRRYVAEINRLDDAARQSGVELFGIFSSPYIGAAEASAWKEEYDATFTILMDTNGDLAAKLQPRVTPEAFVVDTDNRITYRGRIDDQFPAVGSARAAPSTRELRDALQAVHSAAGKLSEQSATGCVFEAWDAAPEPTYHRNVEPLLRKHCSSCHQKGSVAPFELQTYTDARRRAKMIRNVVRDGIMPPWQTRAGHGVFNTTNYVSAHEVSVLDRWIAAGAPEGDAADALPRAAEQRQVAQREPDLRLRMPEPFTVPAESEDIYRYFVLPRSALLDEDQVVTGIGFRAGAKSVVHHADFFVDYSGRARAADDADPEHGFSVFGTGGFLSYFDSGFLGAWAPDGGGGVWHLPEDTGIPVPAGGDIVVEIHHHPTGKEEIDQSELMLFFAKEPVSKTVALVFPGTNSIDMEAGDDRYERRFWMKLPGETLVYSIAPHMHFLGTEVTVDAVLPSGDVEPLLHLDRWDFRWQGSYEFPEPRRFPEGTRIDARFVFDNSADNPHNPVSPPVHIDWGWGTTQEMAELYILTSTEDPADMPALQTSGLMAWYRDSDPIAAEPIAGLDSSRAALDQLGDRSLWSREAQRVLAQIGAEPWFGELRGHFEERLEGASSPLERAQRTADLGNLLVMQSSYQIEQRKSFALAAEADRMYDRALALDAENWDALYGKATSYLAAPPEMNLRAEALRLYERALAVQESGSREIPEDLQARVRSAVERSREATDGDAEDAR